MPLDPLAVPLAGITNAMILGNTSPAAMTRMLDDLLAKHRDQVLAEDAAEQARLVSVAREALAALDDLIHDHRDPGSNALGARYLLAQALVRYPDADKPTADPDTEALALLRNRLADGFACEDAQRWGYDHGFSETYGLDEETDAFVNVAVDALAPLLAARTGQEG